MNNLSSKIGGFLLIFIGVGYLGNQLDIWQFSIFFRGWWALLLAIWGVYHMIENRPNAFNVILTGLGVYWFLSANHWLSFHLTYELLLAILLIYLGIRTMFHQRDERWNQPKDNTKRNSDEHLSIHSTFNTQRYIHEQGKKLYSCRLENTFGSLFVDLREADVSELFEINVENTFGSMELLLPSDVKVIAKEDNIFASYYVDQSYGSKEIYIKENCVFGTLKIRKAKKDHK
ncbi:MAG: hypothetical protein EOM50_03000 [Erysipelotrichia bacterium]|nr:hypothetical protein [Erysipelotrichia bacterium]NCC54120.1 hypothetical protein [Erysipelotrichia bacterium]